MASVKLQHYEASVINPCDLHSPAASTSPVLIYEWPNLTRGNSGRSHDTSTKKQRNVGRTTILLKKPLKTLMAHIIRNTLSAPLMCSDAMEGSSQGGGGGGGGVGTDSGYV